MSKQDKRHFIPRHFYLEDVKLNISAWIRAQAEAYTEVSKRIDENPDRPIDLDKLEVIYPMPDCGWLDTSIMINGEESVCFSLSDWNNPLVSLVEWLEKLIPDERPWEMKEYTFANDCEREEILFHVQTLSTYEEATLCVFIAFDSWIDGNDENPATYGVAVTSIAQIIAAFYRPLIKLLEEMPEDDDDPTCWFSIEQTTNDGREQLETREEWLEEIRSEKIETYLKQFNL